MTAELTAPGDHSHLGTPPGYMVEGMERSLDAALAQQKAKEEGK